VNPNELRAARLALYPPLAGVIEGIADKAVAVDQLMALAG